MFGVETNLKRVAGESSKSARKPWGLARVWTRRQLENKEDSSSAQAHGEVRR